MRRTACHRAAAWSKGKKTAKNRTALPVWKPEFQSVDTPVALPEDQSVEPTGQKKARRDGNRDRLDGRDELPMDQNLQSPDASGNGTDHYGVLIASMLRSAIATDIFDRGARIALANEFARLIAANVEQTSSSGEDVLPSIERLAADFESDQANVTREALAAQAVCRVLDRLGMREIAEAYLFGVALPRNASSTDDHSRPIAKSIPYVDDLDAKLGDRLNGADSSAKQSAIAVALDAIRTLAEFLDALDTLARCLPTIQRRERHDAAVMEKTERVLDALQVGIYYALYLKELPADELKAEKKDEREARRAGVEVLEALYQPARAALNKYESLAKRTGLPFEKKGTFGENLVELLRELQNKKLSGVSAAPFIANWSGWQQTPWQYSAALRLRALVWGHAKLAPKTRPAWMTDEQWERTIPGWCAKEFDIKTDPAKLSRSLLRALGIDATDAKNAVASAT